MIRTELGRISNISFGFGGYQDCEIGVSITLKMKGSGVCDFRGFWADNPSEHAQWTEQDQIKHLDETVLWLRTLLKEAGKQNVEGLKGTPVEVTFEGNLLKEWRILTEVLP